MKVSGKLFALSIAALGVVVLLVPAILTKNGVRQEPRGRESSSRHEGKRSNAEWPWKELQNKDQLLDWERGALMDALNDQDVLTRIWRCYQFQSPEEKRRLEPAEKLRESEVLEKIQRLKNEMPR